MPMPAFLAALRRKVGHDLLLLPTVVVVARDGAGRVLLVRDRDSGRWTLPGGIVEPDETPADAALRELLEEAGTPATLTRLAAVVGGPGCETRYANGDRIAWVACVFSAQLAEVPPRADGVEVTEARLVPAGTLPSLDLRDDAQRFLAAEAAAGAGAWFAPPADRR